MSLDITMKKLLLLILCIQFITHMTAYANEKNINDSTVKLLQDLSEAHAAPGFEKPVRDILIREWKPLLAEIQIDGMKNIIGVMRGNKKKPKILIMAHMDEVGFYIKDITDDGFLRIDQAGGWIDQTILAHRWIITTPLRSVIGYSGIESSHAISTFPAVAPITSKDMFIDIGARNRNEAMEKYGVRPGLPITPDTKFEILNDGERYLGKAFDDRAALAVMTDILKRLSKTQHPNQIIYVATVQEELGSRGAQTIYNSVQPDIVINLEIGVAKDFPLLASQKQDHGHPTLGGGPSIFVYDHSMVPDNGLVDWIINQAKKNHIPYQLESEPMYGQDARYLQISGKGIPAVNIGIPVRYAHQDSGILQRSDYDATVMLIEKILLTLSQDELNEIKNK